MRRQQGRDPQTSNEVLQKQIDELDAGVRQLRSPGATTIQAIDTTPGAPNEYLDPSQGEIAIDHVREKVRFHHAGIWRDIGGSDPAWAALYDDFVYGHLLNSGNGWNAELKFPFTVLSDNAGGIFSITNLGVDTEIGVNTYRLNLLTSGVYSFNLNNDWNDPDKAVTIARYFIDAVTHGQMQFPGENVLPFNGLYDEKSHNTTGLGSWSVLDQCSWHVPIKITTTPCPIWVRGIVGQGMGGADEVTMGKKSFHVIYHGPFNLASGTWP